MNNEEKILALLEQMNARFDTVDSRLDMVDSRLDTVDSRLGGLEQGQNALQTELADVKQGQNALQTELADVKQRVLKIEIVQENITNKRLDSISDGVTGIQEKFNKLDRVEATQEDHGHRIWALEQIAKSK